MSSPLFQYTLGPFDLYVFGQQPRLVEKEDLSQQQALALGANPGMVAQIITASVPTDTGHKQVYPANYNNVLNADGIILREVGSAGIIKTADCGATLLFDKSTGNGALLHTGRPALDPTLSDCAHCGYTVLDNALSLLTKNQSNASVHALVTGNICGPCFVHEGPDAERHIKHFKRLLGAFVDEAAGALDLFAVVKHGLMHHGVPAENINHVGPCTLETPILSSHRRSDQTRNTFIAIKRS